MDQCVTDDDVAVPKTSSTPNKQSSFCADCVCAVVWSVGYDLQTCMTAPMVWPF